MVGVRGQDVFGGEQLPAGTGFRNDESGSSVRNGPPQHTRTQTHLHFNNVSVHMLTHTNAQAQKHKHTATRHPPSHMFYHVMLWEHTQSHDPVVMVH